MIVKDTYYIERNGNKLWLSAEVKPIDDDKVIEIRPMLFADENKMLFKGDEQIGQCVWLKDYKQEDYTEQVIEEETDE